MRRIKNKFYQGELTIITLLVIFEDIAPKLENLGPIFSSFNPFPSLPSVATDDRKQFQCCKIVFNNKARLFFWNSIDFETLFSFSKRYETSVTCKRDM